VNVSIIDNSTSLKNEVLSPSVLDNVCYSSFNINMSA